MAKHWVDVSLWRLSPHYLLFTFLILGPAHTRMSFFLSHLLLMVCSLLELIKCVWSFCTKAGLEKFSFHDPKKKCWVKWFCVIKFPKQDEDESKIRAIFLQPALNLYGSSCTFASRTLRHNSQVRFQNEIMIFWWYRLQRNVNWTVIVVVYVVWLFRDYCFNLKDQ